MPGLITHTYILYKALATYTSTSPLITKITENGRLAAKLGKKHDKDSSEKIFTDLKIDKAVLGSKSKRLKYIDTQCALAGAAYLGACGPDLFYLEESDKGQFLADLMHYNKPGLYMIWCLRSIKKAKDQLDKGLRNDLLMQLAYCLGHITHIAADITVHPYVDTIVQSYPDNSKVFENARGMAPINLWKFHNVLEHYQDAYVLHRRFIGMEGMNDDWQFANVARAGSRYYLDGAGAQEYFLIPNAKGFYKYAKEYSRDLETWKYRFFTDENWILDCSGYYDATIPDEKMMKNRPELVQGGTYRSDGSLEKPGLFDQYLEDAINRAVSFWKEVDLYLATPQTDFTDPQLGPEKKCFATLKRHWNLDTGLSLWADAQTRDWAVPNPKNALTRIAGSLAYRTSHANMKGDVVLPSAK